MVTLQTNGGKDNAFPSVNGAGTIGYDNRGKKKVKQNLSPLPHSIQIQKSITDDYKLKCEKQNNKQNNLLDDITVKYFYYLGIFK